MHPSPWLLGPLLLVHSRACSPPSFASVRCVSAFRNTRRPRAVGLAACGSAEPRSRGHVGALAWACGPVRSVTHRARDAPCLPRHARPHDCASGRCRRWRRRRCTLAVLQMRLCLTRRARSASRSTIRRGRVRWAQVGAASSATAREGHSSCTSLRHVSSLGSPMIAANRHAIVAMR